MASAVVSVKSRPIRALEVLVVLLLPAVRTMMTMTVRTMMTMTVRMMMTSS